MNKKTVSKHTCNKKCRSFSEYLKLVFAGFAMGVANVIPGVSGGTMAFILNVYEELIDSIRQFATGATIKKFICLKWGELLRTLPRRFLLAIGIGMLVAFATAAKIFTNALENQPILTFSFFFGLVVASIFTVFKKVNHWHFSRFVMLLLGVITAYFIITIVPVATPNVWWLSFISGTIVICATILPGISGSFLLLVLGQYKYVWGAVAAISSRQFSLQSISTLFWAGIGCILGLGSFVHLLNWLFKKFHDLTVATLIGFMIGSTWKLWPWKVISFFSVKINNQVIRVSTADIEQYKALNAKIKPLVEHNVLPSRWDNNLGYAILLAALGVFLVFAMEWLANRKNSAR